MTKKIIGICIIVLGSVIFAVQIYSLSRIFFQPELIKAKTEQQLVDKGFTQEQIELGMKMSDKMMGTTKIVSSVIALIGIVIAFGGFMMYKKGVKDSQLSTEFNFD